jgi:hypothetical protein
MIKNGRDENVYEWGEGRGGEGRGGEGRDERGRRRTREKTGARRSTSMDE